MPDPQANPGILRRLFGNPISTQGIIPNLMGGVMSESMATRNPDVENSWNKLSIENPQNAAKVNRIGEMGYLKRMLSGKDTYGSTSPFGTIELNMDAIRRNKQDINDVLSHEMAHAGQGIGGWLKSFYSNQPEDSAINAEVFRNRPRTSNIELKAPDTGASPIRQAYNTVR